MLLNFWDWSCANECTSCRFRKILKNSTLYLLAKICVDTAKILPDVDVSSIKYTSTSYVEPRRPVLGYRGASRSRWPASSGVAALRAALRPRQDHRGAGREQRMCSLERHGDRTYVATNSFRHQTNFLITWTPVFQSKILNGPFSAVPTPIFAIKYSLE